MKTICFYHSRDLDGQCCGAIMARARPHAELIPYDYGDPFPWDRVKGQDVHMADVSLQPFSDMIKLSEVVQGGGSLTWIDHHKSAIDEETKAGARFYAHGVRQDGTAACELAWRYYFPNISLPRAVQLLAAYDVWKWKDVPGAIEFQYGMRLGNWRNVRDSAWDALLHEVSGDHFARASHHMENIKDQGEVILAYETQQHTRIAKSTSFETSFEGLRAIAVNRSHASSQLFDSVWDPEKHDVMIAFYLGRERNWRVSLYSTKEEVDCAVLAKKHGGGGHKGAAGFQCQTLPF